MIDCKDSNFKESRREKSQKQELGPGVTFVLTDINAHTRDELGHEGRPLVQFHE